MEKIKEKILQVSTPDEQFLWFLQEAPMTVQLEKFYPSVFDWFGVKDDLEREKDIS